MDQETTIQVGKVSEIATAVAAVGKDLHAAGTTMLGLTSQGGSAMHGSAFCAQLPGFAGSYAALVDDLGKQVSAFSADLQRTADDYSVADRTAHARIVNAGH